MRTSLKKIIYSVILTFLFCFTCNATDEQKKIEVYYLTANAYCPSVEQIEQAAKVVLDSLYTSEITNGLIEIHKLDIMLDENQGFVHKWEISTNGLMLLVYNNNSGEKVDLNDFAFSNVPSDVPTFKSGFAKILSDKLKEIAKE